MKKSAFFVIIFFALSASASRIEVMKWTDPSGQSVDGFNIYKRTTGGTFGPAVSMGNPTPDGSGVRTFNYTIPETTGNVYFKATAFDIDREGNKGADGPECADGATSCTVRWTFAFPGAKKFYIYQRVAPSTTYGPRIDAGLPTPVNGEYSFTVAAPSSGVKFHAVSVVQDVESVVSNEICRDQTGQPCENPPPPPLAQPTAPALIP